MSFIIKNIDAGNVSIDDLGITLVPAEEYNLAQDNANDVALSVDLPAAITAGTVAVLDPLDNLTQLSLSDAQAAVAAMNDSHYRIRGGTLNQLDDVGITSPASGEVLYLNGSTWENASLATAGIAAASHTHLKADVTDFVEGDYVHTTGNETIAGVKTFTSSMKVGGSLSSVYTLSVQGNTDQTWLEILNNGGANQGVFFGILNNNFELWNYQGGNIVFYTSPAPSSGAKRFTISNAGAFIFHPLAGAAGIATLNVNGALGKGASINLLTDVDLSGSPAPANGDVLQFNGTSWVHTQLSGTQPTFETITTPAGGPVVADSAGDTLALTTSTGLNITGDAGTDTINFAPANDLAALEALATTGFAARTGTETWALRSLTQPAAGLTITNPAGVAGNPTFALANDLAAVEGLGTTGIAVRTAADTWTTRSVAGTANQITVTNGSGVSGNPVIALANNPIIPGTAGIDIPSGTTAERPGSPTTGVMRFNTTTGSYEAWDGTQWVTFGAGAGSSVKEILFGQLSHLQGTTQIPADNTPPLVTEGTQFFSQSVTTQTSGGRIVLWFSSVATVSDSSRIATISLFRDSTLIGVTAISAPGSNSPQPSTFIIVDAPGAAGTYTYSGRIGVSASATWYIGGFTTNFNYGGAANTNNQYVLMRVE